MSTNFLQNGDVLDHTPSSAKTSGQVVVIGARIGVCLAAIAANATGPLAVKRVFTLPKLSTDVVAQGALLYWDNGNTRLTTTVGSNVLAGYATAAAGNGVATVAININS